MPLYLQTKIHHSKRLQFERSCFLKANRCVGNNGVVMAKNNTKCWCKCFGRYSPQELKAIYLSKHEPSTSSFHLPFTTESHPSRGFSPKSSSEATAVLVLRIHGRLGLQEPLRHGVVAVGGCEVQRCSASGAADPRRKPQGRTQTERRGEKKF